MTLDELQEQHNKRMLFKSKRALNMKNNGTVFRIKSQGDNNPVSRGNGRALKNKGLHRDNAVEHSLRLGR